MDLRTRKYIKNTQSLPGFKDGFFPQPNSILPTQQELDNLDYKLYKNGLKNSNGHIDLSGEIPSSNKSGINLNGIMSKGADVAQGALGLVSMAINNSRPIAIADDFVKNANVTQSSVGNYSYDTYGEGGESQAMQQASANVVQGAVGGALSGAAAGSALGPFGAIGGGVIGGALGLFSGNSAKRALREQIRQGYIKKDNKTKDGYYLASTMNAREKQAKEYGDLEQQRLIDSAASGKRPVWSPYGLISRSATARVSNGELVGNFEDGVATRIPGRKNNNDTKLAALKDRDFVISNKYGLSDYAASSGDYIGALNLQEMLLGKHRNIRGYADGKPGFRIPSELLPSLFNTYVGIDQLLDSKQQLSSPQSYRANRYENVLQGLDDIDVNMLPIYNNNRNVGARSRNAIISSGGLSAGQLTSALAANSYNTQLSDAQALAQAQLQRNQYKLNSIDTKYNAGAQDAARLTAADQWDYTQHAAAHNAAMQQGQMGLYNIANAWREGYKNTWDREQFEKMYGLYFQDMKNKEMYYNFLRNGGMDNAPSTSTFAPTLRQQYGTIQNPYGMVSPLQVTSVLPTIEEINSLRYTPSPDMPKPAVIKQKTTTVRPKRTVVTEAPTKKAVQTVKKNTNAQTKSTTSPKSIDLTRPVDKEYKFQTIKQIVEDNRNAVLGNLSNVDAKKAKPRKDATTNARALKNMIDYLMLGQKEYNKRYK